MFVKQLLLYFWAYVSCQCVNSSASQLKTPKEKQSKRSLLTMRKWRWRFPHSRAFSPSEGFGGVTKPFATQPPGTTFPKDQLPPSWRFPKQWQPLLTKRQQGYFEWGPVRSKRKVKPCFNVKNHVHQTITVFIGRPTLEERSPNSLALSEQHYTMPTAFVLRAPRTAIISSSWMIVRCPLDIIALMTFFSTSVLKNDNCSPTCWWLFRQDHSRQGWQMTHLHNICAVSLTAMHLYPPGCVFTKQLRESGGHFSVRSDKTFLPWVTLFDKAFKSLLNSEPSAEHVGAGKLESASRPQLC